MNVYVIYASMRGHVQILAEAIADGARSVSGANVAVKSVDGFDPGELRNADAIIWGSSGYFGLPNPKMMEFFTRLDDYWFAGGVEGKFGGVFTATSATHGGLEITLRNLQLPMQHLGINVVSNTGDPTAQRTQYGCPYGVGAVIPLEDSGNTGINKPSLAELQLAKEYGRLVVQTAEKAMLAVR